MPVNANGRTDPSSVWWTGWWLEKWSERDSTGQAGVVWGELGENRNGKSTPIEVVAGTRPANVIPSISIPRIVASVGENSEMNGVSDLYVKSNTEDGGFLYTLSNTRRPDAAVARNIPEIIRFPRGTGLVDGGDLNLAGESSLMEFKFDAMDRPDAKDVKRGATCINKLYKFGRRGGACQFSGSTSSLL